MLEEHRAAYGWRSESTADDDDDQKDPWDRHLDSCAECRDALLMETLVERQVDPGRYPCVHLAYYCTEHLDSERMQEENNIVEYVPKFREFFVASSSPRGPLLIYNCPWCGLALPPSMRDLWFDTLDEMGIEPYTDEVPAAFRSEEWYRNLELSDAPGPDAES